MKKKEKKETYNEEACNDVGYCLESASNTTESKFGHDDNFQIFEETLEEDDNVAEKANDDFNVDVLGITIMIASIVFRKV